MARLILFPGKISTSEVVLLQLLTERTNTATVKAHKENRIQNDNSFLIVLSFTEESETLQSRISVLEWFSPAFPPRDLCGETSRVRAGPVLMLRPPPWHGMFGSAFTRPEQRAERRGIYLLPLWRSRVRSAAFVPGTEILAPLCMQNKTFLCKKIEGSSL